MSNKILFVVSKDFLNSHIGVRRVIKFYFQEIIKLGFQADWAIADDNKIIKISFRGKTFEEIYAESFCEEREDVIITADKLHEKHVYTSWVHQETKDFYDKKYVIDDLETYYRVILTAPWAVSERFPIVQNSIGIVYDIIPNLISLGKLKFVGASDPLIKFAFLHKVGFEYYLNNCVAISHISRHTMADFQMMRKYSKSSSRDYAVIPFSFSLVSRPTGNLKDNQEGPYEILCVNFFDARKNFLKGVEALLNLKKSFSFSVSFVGGPRMELSEIFYNLKRFSAAGIDFRWHVNSTDRVLEEQYKSADVLFFPSIYEGLGLPILEAQSFGKPCVTSSGGACGEINFFPEISGDADSIVELTKALERCLINLSKYKDSNFFEERAKKIFSEYSSVSQLLS